MPLWTERCRCSKDRLGTVEHIVSPNKLHHLFMGQWTARYSMRVCTHRKRSRECLQRVFAWQPQRVLLLHGPCVMQDATEFLRHGFAWVMGDAN
jgi:hypothetical protein